MRSAQQPSGRLRRIVPPPRLRRLGRLAESAPTTQGGNRTGPGRERTTVPTARKPPGFRTRLSAGVNIRNRRSATARDVRNARPEAVRRRAGRPQREASTPAPVASVARRVGSGCSARRSEADRAPVAPLRATKPRSMKRAASFDAAERRFRTPQQETRGAGVQGALERRADAIRGSQRDPKPPAWRRSESPVLTRSGCA